MYGDKKWGRVASDHSMELENQSPCEDVILAKGNTAVY